MSAEARSHDGKKTQKTQEPLRSGFKHVKVPLRVFPRTHCGSAALLHGDFIIRVAIVTGVEEGFVNVGLATRFTVFLSFSAALFLISTLPII